MVSNVVPDADRKIILHHMIADCLVVGLEETARPAERN